MEPVMFAHDLADRLGLPAAWLKREARAGRLPCLKVGRRLLFSPSAVEAVLARRAAEVDAREVDPASAG